MRSSEQCRPTLEWLLSHCYTLMGQKWLIPRTLFATLTACIVSSVGLLTSIAKSSNQPTHTQQLPMSTETHHSVAFIWISQEAIGARKSTSASLAAIITGHQACRFF